MQQAAQSKESVAFQALFQESLPKLSREVVQQWMNNPDKLKEYLAGLAQGCEPTTQGKKSPRLQEGGVIYLPITTQALNGPTWIHHLEGLGAELDLSIRNWLRGHKDITPTFAPIATDQECTLVLVPAHFFPQKKRTARQLFDCLKDVKLTTLPWEACLHVADYFTKKAKETNVDIELAISFVSDPFVDTMKGAVYIPRYAMWPTLDKSVMSALPAESLRKGKLERWEYIAFRLQE